MLFAAKFPPIKAPGGAQDCNQQEFSNYLQALASVFWHAVLPSTPAANTTAELIVLACCTMIESIGGVQLVGEGTFWERR